MVRHHFTANDSAGSFSRFAMYDIIVNGLFESRQFRVENIKREGCFKIKHRAYLSKKYKRMQIYRKINLNFCKFDISLDNLRVIEIKVSLNQ